MVAPLIIKGARVVTKPKSTKGTKKFTAPSNTIEQPSTQRTAQQGEGQAQATPQRRAPRYPRGNRMLRRALAPQTAGIEQRIWAFSAAYFIIACTIPFYAPQLFFFMFGIGGLGFEAIPFFNTVIPGTEMFLLAWAFTLLIGVGSMLFAAVVFNIRGIDAFGGNRAFVFITCLIGYLTLFLSIIPWVVIWALFVAYNHGSGDTE